LKVGTQPRDDGGSPEDDARPVADHDRFKCILRRLATVVLLQACALPALASGGSIYSNSLGFTVIGIDDGTWLDIHICDSIDEATSASPAHCLILRKGGRTDGGYTAYSDARSGCRLLGKYEEQSHASGHTDDEFMLKQFFAVIKVPRGMRNCSLMFKAAPGGPARRSVTGIYRSP